MIAFGNKDHIKIGKWEFRLYKKGKRKVQGVPQSQTAALPRPQQEEGTDKSKQAQTKQTYEKHQDQPPLYVSLHMQQYSLQGCIHPPCFAWSGIWFLK